MVKLSNTVMTALIMHFETRRSFPVEFGAHLPFEESPECHDCGRGKGRHISFMLRDESHYPDISG